MVMELPLQRSDLNYIENSWNAHKKLVRAKRPTNLTKFLFEKRDSLDIFDRDERSSSPVL